MVHQSTAGYTYEDGAFFQDTAPYILFFAAVYFMSSNFSGILFPSFNKLPTGGKDKETGKIVVNSKSIWGSSVNSMILSVWVPYLSIQAGLDAGKFLIYDLPIEWTSMALVEISKIMMGYFIVDGLVCLYYREEWGSGWQMFAIHHISGAWYLRSVMINNAGYSSLLAMNITEVSNFFNMMRFFISNIKDDKGASVAQRYPQLELANGIVFTITFAILRIYAFSHIGWWALIHERVALSKYSAEFQITIHCCFIIGISLQYWWMYLITKGLYKVLKKGSKNETNGDKLK